MRNPKPPCRARPARQRGAALVVALIILLTVTLLSLSGVVTSVLEIRIARSSQADTEVFQLAQSGADYAVSTSGALPTTGATGAFKTIDLSGDSLFSTATGESIVVRAARTRDCALPPRSRRGTSAEAYKAFHYEIEATVNRNATGWGRNGLTQGWIMLGPGC
jgi:Tfp pilus assembly protein PilX